MRYIGHLDLFRSWERTFRRAGLPLAYSQGFHPQPRMNLACALPLGFTSECEVLDVWLEQEFNLDHIQAALSKALPPGVKIMDVQAEELSAPSLQTQVISAIYMITFLDPIPDLETRLQRIDSALHLNRIRRNKPYDLHPLIEAMIIMPVNESGNQRLRVQLAARASATGRPEELLDEMGLQFSATRVHRERLLFSTT